MDEKKSDKWVLVDGELRIINSCTGRAKKGKN